MKEMSSLFNAAAYSFDIAPTPEITDLSQEIWEDEAMYCIVSERGKRVHYLTIPVHPDPILSSHNARVSHF